MRPFSQPKSKFNIKGDVGEQIPMVGGVMADGQKTVRRSQRVPVSDLVLGVEPGNPK